MEFDEPLYVILYRDGKIGEATTWRRTLMFVQIARNVAWPFKAVCVVEWDYLVYSLLDAQEAQYAAR